MYNEELFRQNDLLKYGVSLTQKQIDDGERRLEQLKQRYVVAGGKESDLEDSELKKNYGNSAKTYNQQTNVANALAWKEHYYTTANEKVGTLTSSLERLYTELNRNSGDKGLKKHIRETATELTRAKKEARSTAKEMNRIIDVYAKLSHNAGVTAQDLAAGVERSGSVAHQAGMDFEFLTALIAQATRSTALSGLTNTSPFMLETA